MRGLFIFLLVAGLVVLGLYLLGQRETFEPQAQVPETPAKPPWVTTPTPKPKAAKPPAPNLPPDSIIDDPSLHQLARKASVELLQFDRVGATGTVTVQWSSDVVTQGMDYIEELRRAGKIGGFDENSWKSHPTVIDGRRFFRMTINVRF